MTQVLMRWSSAQMTTLRRHALTLLFRLAPLCPDSFFSLDGAGILLQFVKHTDNLQHIECAMRVLRHLVQVHGYMRPWLGGRHAITIARGRFQDASMPQDLRQEAVVLLHALCLDCAENMERFEAEGMIGLLAKEIQAHRDIDPLLPSYFVIEMISLAWTAILFRATALKVFLLVDGAQCPVGFPLVDQGSWPAAAVHVAHSY
jgi:hypothetical protein